MYNLEIRFETDKGERAKHTNTVNNPLGSTEEFNAVCAEVTDAMTGEDWITARVYSSGKFVGKVYNYASTR